MMYADQPTPPFNSPYQQHTSRPGSLLESGYPSPVRHESQPEYTQGLGLYEVQQSLPTGLPPSPQPSETWVGHYTTGASPLMTDTLANPYTSGAFEHPVTRSPLPWSSAQTSPRSSLSSYTREMSVFSHDGSDNAYTSVKMEGAGWASEIQFRSDGQSEMTGLASSSRHTPLTVAPERLSADMFSSYHSYTPAMPRYGQTPVFDYNNRDYERGPSEDSVTSPRSQTHSHYTGTRGNRTKTRNRRHTTPAHASFRCPICADKYFARRYNLNQHMLTHEMHRRRDHLCSFPGCKKEFVRKTDLARHNLNVHQKARPWVCERCSHQFGRKDTLKRHGIDGCPRKNQVPASDPRLAILRHGRYGPRAKL